MGTDNKMILARRAKKLLGEEVKYILFAEGGEETEFSMTVEYKGESETCDLGTMLEAALEIFLRIQNGGVTPCTLNDVVEDIFSK